MSRYKGIRSLFLNEKFIMTVIIINAVMIFFQEYQTAPRWLDYFDNIFTLLFTAEMAVKINTFGFRGYWSNSWNKLDFVLVVLALASMLVQLFSFGRIEALEFILILRVFRVFKSLRLVRFVPNITQIIAGVHRAVKSSSVVVFAFFILLFISSILTCAIFQDLAPEFFSTPLDSIYSTFRVFSTDGWYEIPDLIASRSSPVVGFMTKLYFVILLFVGGILGISLINSIFVDAMLSTSSDKLESKVEILTDKLDQLINEIQAAKIKSKKKSPGRDGGTLT